jgi:hypothetical protein
MLGEAAPDVDPKNEVSPSFQPSPSRSRGVTASPMLATAMWTG